MGPPCCEEQIYLCDVPYITKIYLCDILYITDADKALCAVLKEYIQHYNVAALCNVCCSALCPLVCIFLGTKFIFQI